MQRMLVLLVAAFLLPAPLLVTPGVGSPAGEDIYNETTDGTFRYLVRVHAGDAVPVAAADLEVQKERLDASARFSRELTQGELDGLETIFDIQFLRQAYSDPEDATTDLGTRISHVGPIYLLSFPWDAEPIVTQLGLGLDLGSGPFQATWIEPIWHPFLQVPLDLSVPELATNDAWNQLDYGPAGNQTPQLLSGDGIVVADLDTGIDVFHPMFFFADGASYDWIDDDGDGNLTFGTDAIDLDGDSTVDANETLEYLNVNSNTSYEAGKDWLYADLDGDGNRDFDSGFTESDATFGEPLFWFNDTNGNGSLDLGEQVVALNTSKILRVSDSGGDWVRGTDLINAAPDNNGHGTGVSGIINAGTVGQTYVGVAPGAELIVRDAFTVGFESSLTWALNHNADVVLYEVGGWVGFNLDGSSNLAGMMDGSVADTVHVNPAGNLAGSNRHANHSVDNLGTNFELDMPASYSSVWLSILWQNTSLSPTITFATPNGGAGNTTVVDGTGNTVTTTDNHDIYSDLTTSSRGTMRMDVQISRSGGSESGNWPITITGSSDPTMFHLFCADSATSWSGGCHFNNYNNPAYTTTWPATADSAITVASFGMRNNSAYADYGQLSSFSGRGPRIDNVPIMDIAAPGDLDIISAGSKDAGYNHGQLRWFGGTSAAGPHVAGAAALFLQANAGVNAAHAEAWAALNASGRADSWTGAVPNEDWGVGKMNVSRWASADLVDPVADAGGNQSGPPGIFTFNGVAADNRGPGGLNATWSFVYNSNPVEFYTPAFQFDFQISDTYTLTMMVQDAAGNTVFDQIELVVADVNPPVSDPGPELWTDEGIPVVFDGSNSSDDGLIVNYTWNITGQVGLFYGTSFAYNFSTGGDYDVTLTVRDQGPNLASNTTTVHVATGVGPTVVAGPAINITEGDTVFLDGSGSSDDHGIVSQTWSVAGSIYYSPWANHTFPVFGDYNATLTVVDIQGFVGQGVRPIHVADGTPPVANISGPSEIGERLPLILDGSGSSDNAGIVNYSWTFLDLNQSVVLYGDEMSYNFSAPQTTNISLEVTDAVGLSHNATLVVTVHANTDPEVSVDLRLGNEEFIINWNATDVDGDGLSLDLQLQRQVGTSWTVHESVPAQGGRATVDISAYGQATYRAFLDVIDARGGTTNASSPEVFVDRAPPAPSITTPIVVTGTGATIAWTSTDPGDLATFSIVLDGLVANITDASARQAQLSNLSLDTTFEVIVRSTDLGGASADSEAVTFSTPEPEDDNLGFLPAGIAGDLDILPLALGAAGLLLLLLVAMILLRRRKPGEESPALLAPPLFDDALDSDAPPALRECPVCGFRLNEKEHYCSACGAELQV